MAQQGRKRRERAITIAGPRSAKQVMDKDLWAEGRKKIGEAALPLFLKYGYHATPVRVIARAAGISSGSIFNYFSGKDEILEFVLDDSQAAAESSVNEAQAELATSKDGGDPVETFLRVFRRYAESLDEIRRYVLLAYQETKSLTPKQQAPLFEREKRIAQILKAAAEPAIRSGVFAKDALELRVHSLIILAQAWAVRHWAWAHYPSVEEYVDDLEPVVVGIMKGAEVPKGKR